MATFLTTTQQCVLSLEEAVKMISDWMVFHPDQVVTLHSEVSRLIDQRVWYVEVYNMEGSEFVGFLFNDTYYQEQ